MRTFQEVVTRDAAAYVLPYKVHADGSKTVLYYLVHLTNSDLGMRVMKEKMVKKSGEMTFFPITLRPTDQLGFGVEEAAPFPSLQRYLLDAYAGRSLTFVELLNEGLSARAQVAQERLQQGVAGDGDIRFALRRHQPREAPHREGEADSSDH